MPKGTSSSQKIDWKRLLHHFFLSREMDRIEEEQLVPEGLVHHQFSARGHELVQLLLAHLLTHPSDAVSAYYRSRPLQLGLNIPPEEIMASMMAREGGHTDGRDSGVMANYPGKKRIKKGVEAYEGPYLLPMSGDVGSQYTPAAGWAQALKYRAEVLKEKSALKAISVVCGGESSVATNGFWSSITMASTLQLPVLYLIEDNGYGISVPGSLQTPGGNIVNNLYSFGGIELFDGDGVQPADVLSLLEMALEHVRSWNGPALVRLSVPRLNGHSYQDNQSYKTATQLEQEQGRDPYLTLRNYLVPSHFSELEWIRIEKQASETVVKVVDSALKRPKPDPSKISESLFRKEWGGKEHYPKHEPTESAIHGGVVLSVDLLSKSSQNPNSESLRINMVEAIRRTLEVELKVNPSLLLFGEDVGQKGGVHAATLGLQQLFGDDRVFDTSLSEEGIVGRAVGMAYAGLKPVAEIQFRKYADPATEQLKNAGSVRWRTKNKFSAPLVVRVPGGFAKIGDPWHSESAESFFTHLPGWQVVMPSDAEEATGLLRSALRSDNPTLFFEHRNLLDSKAARRPYPGDDYVIPFGQARTLRSGGDLTIITWGAMVWRCDAAVEELIASGGVTLPEPQFGVSEPKSLSIELIDLRTLSPWDKDAVLRSVQKTGRCLIVHEDGKTNGFGAEIAATIVDEAFQWLDAPVKRIASPDLPVPYAEELMDKVVPSIHRIREGILEILQK